MKTTKRRKGEKRREEKRREKKRRHHHNKRCFASSETSVCAGLAQTFLSFKQLLQDLSSCVVEKVSNSFTRTLQRNVMTQTKRDKASFVHLTEIKDPSSVRTLVTFSMSNSFLVKAV